MQGDQNEMLITSAMSDQAGGENSVLQSIHCSLSWAVNVLKTTDAKSRGRREVVDMH